MPASLQNGVYRIRLVLGDTDRNASNARTLEVIPLVALVVATTVTVIGKDVHRLTARGARLNGGDVRFLIDGIAYQADANSDASQAVYTLSRLLDAGSHSVALVIDGSRSHDISLQVA